MRLAGLMQILSMWVCGKSQRDRIKILKEIIRDLQDEFKGAVPIEDIISKQRNQALRKIQLKI